MNTLCGILIVSLHFSYTFGVEVTGPPATTYVNLGDTAVLSCFVTGHINGTMTWSKITGGSPTEYFQIGPGGAVTDGDGLSSLSDLSDYSVVVDPVDSTDYWANMTIAGVDSDDLGQYSCWTGTFGDEADVGELLLAELPSSVVISDEVEVFEGVAQTLTCKAYDSKPQVSIQWTIDSSNVSESSTNFTKDSDGSYTTTSTMTYNYTCAMHQRKKVDCVATNIAGTTQPTSVTLNVGLLVGPTSPVMSDSDGDYPNGTVVTLHNGTEHSFSCVARGANPAANITWHLNGTEVTSQDLPTTSPINTTECGTLFDTNSTLTFTPDYSNQKNTLTCRATNLANDRESFVILEIYVSPGHSDVFIVDHSAGEEVTVLYNTVLNLTCQVNGVNPAANITWYNNDEDITDQSQPNTTQLLDGLYNIESVLTFTPQKSDHNHTIKCQASHVTLDSSQYPITFIQLNVEFAATITNQNEDDAYADEGGEAVLRCEAEGNPPPNFTWTKNNTVITSDENHIDIDESDLGVFASSSTLTITSVDPGRDFGNYTCHTHNSHGYDILTINLNGTTVPEPATNISVTDATDTALTVTWVEGRDGGHPQTFTVQYRVGGLAEEGNWVDSEQVDHPPVTLTGLQPLSQYEIRVRSNNTLGSELSQSIKANTTAVPIIPTTPTTTATTTPSATPTTTPSATQRLTTTGPTHSESPTPINKNIMYIIIGASIGGVLLIAITISLVVWVCRCLLADRRKHVKDSPLNSLEMTSVPPPIEDSQMSLLPEQVEGQNGHINQETENPNVPAEVHYAQVNKIKKIPNVEAQYAQINKKSKKPSSDETSETLIPTTPEVPPFLENNMFEYEKIEGDVPNNSHPSEQTDDDKAKYSSPYEQVEANQPKDEQVDADKPKDSNPYEQVGGDKPRDSINPYEQIPKENPDEPIPGESPRERRRPNEDTYELVSQPEKKQNNPPQGLVYADLDFPQPAAAAASSQPKPKAEETAYATIDFSGDGQGVLI